jgi:hypothetical protein
MKERPVLFNGEMVRAILDGRKTQTRRLVKHPAEDGKHGWHPSGTGMEFRLGGSAKPVCPFGKIGDRLWVRESWSGEYWLSEVKPSERFGLTRQDCLTPFPPLTHYWADGDPEHGDWEKPRPSIHMPRWASRITLEITGVRVERLNDIGQFDAMAEGAEPEGEDFVAGFMNLWKRINGSESWDQNPWVWVVNFRRLGNAK